MDSGEKFLWEFDNEGKDKLFYVTEKGIKTSVTTVLGVKFFPPVFDIDKFLQSTPKKAQEQLQAMVGVDFTEIDTRYASAYTTRTEKNKELERAQVKLAGMTKVEKVEKVDLTNLQQKKEAERDRLNKLYVANKEANEKLRSVWNSDKSKIDDECLRFNKIQQDSRIAIINLRSHRAKLKSLIAEMPGWVELVDLTKLNEHIDSLPEAEPEKVAADLYPAEPEYVTEMPDDSVLKEIDEQILTASQTNAQAQDYDNYIAQKTAVETAKEEAKVADDLVKSIEAERKKMMKSAKFPKGISITTDGITVDGLPLDRNQISTSKLYTAALRIASMKLGEVKTLHFDASFLDRDSLTEIEQWAAEEGLQLLIERPDFDGGEIKYELIEN